MPLQTANKKGKVLLDYLISHYTKKWEKGLLRNREQAIAIAFSEYHKIEGERHAQRLKKKN